MKKNKLKYSVIGTSWITKSFIEGTSLVPELELYGVYSRTEEKGSAFAAETGACAVFTSLEALAASDSDFIYVASPNSCHYEQCRFLLSHRKNVICEKPITVTAAEFRELSALAEKNGVIYFEAIMYMHTPARAVLKSALEKLGVISSVQLDYSQLSSKYPALKRGELPNIFNPVMKTGALNDLGVYCVYPMLDIFGRPEKTVCSQFKLKTGADGSGGALFNYDDKFISITYSKTGQSRLGSQILGDEGTVTIESISQLTGVKLYDNEGNCTLLVDECEKKYLMRNEAQSMVNFITDFDKYRDFYGECTEMSEKVLECMEQMRV